METVNLLRPADYVDAERYEQEAQRVLRAGWMPACRADQGAQPGARFALTLAGRPIVVTRAADGALHVLANVCQHRGAMIVDDGPASGARRPRDGRRAHLPVGVELEGDGGELDRVLPPRRQPPEH